MDDRAELLAEIKFLREERDLYRAANEDACAELAALRARPSLRVWVCAGCRLANAPLMQHCVRCQEPRREAEEAQSG